MAEPSLGLRCTHWQPLRRGALLGYAAIELTANGVIVNSIPIFADTDGSVRAGVPTHPLLGSDGSVLLKGGKPSRMPTLAFASAETRERFRRATVAALRGKFPAGLPTVGGSST